MNRQNDGPDYGTGRETTEGRFGETRSGLPDDGSDGQSREPNSCSRFMKKLMKSRYRFSAQRIETLLIIVPS